MTNNQTYLKSLKGELDSYTKKLSTIQKSFKGNTQKDVATVYNSLANILKEGTVAYTKLASASDAEWDVMKTKAGEAVDNVKSAFADALSASAGKLQQYETMIEEYSEEKIDLAEEYIRTHPIKSVLMAAGVGFIVARILK